jgi:hypothetical protein
MMTATTVRPDSPMSHLDTRPNVSDPPASPLRFRLLMTAETAAIAALLWGSAPIYRAILAAPGQQLADIPSSPFLIIAGLVVFHAAYWHRLRQVPVAIGGRSLLLSHLVVFTGRLCFVFGGSMFALVAFRHVPEMGQIVDPLRLISRSLAMLAVLFSLFCYVLELERIGVALHPLR